MEKVKNITNNRYFEAVVIGVSSGGLKALEKVLASLPADFTLPVIIVQHRARDSNDFLCRFLDNICRINVKEAEDKMPVKGGCVYLAPPDYHLLVETERIFALSIDPPVNWSRPSIDILFETAAEVYQEGLIGVIMTGANTDGSMGLVKIKQAGGICIIQNPDTAEMPQMPLSAIEATKENHHILSLEEIGSFLAGVRGIENGAT